MIVESRLTTEEAARSSADLVDRVVSRRDTFLIERKDRPVCRIVPVRPAKFTLRDLAQLLKAIPKPDPEYWGDLEEINRMQPRLPRSRRAH